MNEWAERIKNGWTEEMDLTEGIENEQTKGGKNGWTERVKLQTAKSIN